MNATAMIQSVWLWALGAFFVVSLVVTAFLTTPVCLMAGPGTAYPTLESALRAAQPGCTVVLLSGEYRENVTVRKEVRILPRSEVTFVYFTQGNPGGPPFAVFAARARPVTLIAADPERPALEIRAQGVEIRGLRVRGGSEGIRVYNTRDVRLVRNRITHASRAGIALLGTQRIVVSYNEIAQSPVGLLVENSRENALYKNRLRGNAQGIVLRGSRENRVARNVVEASREDGILLESSDRNELVQNAIERNARGLSLLASTQNVLRENRWRNNPKPLRVWGSLPRHFVHAIETSNSIDGRPVLYLMGQKGVKVTARHRPAYLALIRSEGVVVEGVVLPPGSQGILLVETQKSTLRNVVLRRTEFGVYALNSRENTLEGVRIEQPETDGIVLEDSHANRLARNSIVGAGRYGVLLARAEGNSLAENRIERSREAGIYLKESRKARLEGNRLRGNWVGVYLERGGGHSLVRNWIRESQFGIFLQSSSGNAFQANRLENNRHDANVATLPEPGAPPPAPPPSQTTDPSSSSKGGS